MSIQHARSLSRIVFSVAAALVIAAALPATVAHAGEAESRTLFAEGRQLREQGKCAEAIIMFRKSLETYPEGLGAMRNIAECEEEIGRVASSRRTWRDLRLAVQRSGEARYEGWDRDAEEAQKRLEPRVPKIIITLEGKGQVLLNGRPFDPRLLGVELEQDLGTLEVVLEDDSAVPQKRALVMEEGGRYKVELRAREKGAGGGPGPDPVEPPAGSTDESGPSGLLIGGSVALSLGGAALIGMGVAIGIHQSALGELEDGCPNYETVRCPQDLEPTVSRGESASIAVNVLAAVGGAAVGTGVILLVVDATSGGDKPATTGQVAVRPLLAPLLGGGFVGLEGAF